MSNQEPLEIVTTAEQRQADMELMRKHDRKHVFPSVKYEVKDILAELNLRFSQYVRQSSFSIDFKILQTVHDFQNMLMPLQSFPKKKTLNERIAKAKVDYLLPIAEVDKKKVYINQDTSVFEIFTYTKP